jgi:glycogen operon protein
LLRESTVERQRVTLTELIGSGDSAWHGVTLYQPDWSDTSDSIAFSAESQKQGFSAYFIFNAYWEPLDFELPPIGKAKRSSWRRWIDTSQDSPYDMVPWTEAPVIPDQRYHVGRGL